MLFIPYPIAMPVLNPLKLCYVSVETSPGTVQSESIVVAGSAFTPNALVDLSLDGDVVVSGAVTTNEGVLPRGLVASPEIRSGQRVFRLEAVERDNPDVSIGLESFTAALRVRVTPQRAAPARRVRFRGRGFTGSGAVYAHYLRAGKLRRTVRLAKVASGACGTFDVRRPQFPFEPSNGTWRVQIDQHRRLSDEGPLVYLTIDVRRRARTR